MIAIGIALRDEDETLHKTKSVCNGVTCLQLLYGAVVYRSQHTIHHMLGDLSISKQLSREISTPVTPYTSNNLIEVISSGRIADDTDSNTTEDTRQSEVETPRAESSSAETTPSEPSEHTKKTNNEQSKPDTSITPQSSERPPDQTPKESTPPEDPSPLVTNPDDTTNSSNQENTSVSRSVIRQTSRGSVDTPTDTDGGDSTDETYTTDIDEIVRAVYPGLGELLSDEEEEEEGIVFLDEDGNEVEEGDIDGQNDRNRYFIIR